jgi:hypothetical protein
MIDELGAAKSQCRPIVIDRHLANAIEICRPQDIPTLVAVNIARIPL